MNKLSQIIALCMILIGCARLPNFPIYQDSVLDYGRLYRIAENLLSPSRDKNLEGLHALDDISGLPITSNFLAWYEATKLGLKAANSIIHGIRSRDTLTQQVIYEYTTGFRMLPPTAGEAI